MSFNFCFYNLRLCNLLAKPNANASVTISTALCNYNIHYGMGHYECHFEFTH